MIKYSRIALKVPKGQTWTIMGTQDISYYSRIEKLIDMRFDCIGIDIMDYDFYYKNFIGE